MFAARHYSGMARRINRPASPPEPTPSKELPELVAKIDNDAHNEQVVIAAACVSPEERAKLVRVLSPDAFYAKGHPAIWRALSELDRRHLQYDPLTIAELSNKTVDIAYLEKLIELRPAVPPNLQMHVDCMLWDRIRTQAAQGPVAALLDAIRDPVTEPEKIRGIARNVATSFDAGPSHLRFLRDSNAVVAGAKLRIEERMARFKKGEVCYPYGIEGLDRFEDGSPRLIPGMAPKQITLIAGLAKSGKTTVTNQIVLGQIGQRKKVLHGAWEQDAEDTLESLAAFALGISRSRRMVGDISEAERKAIETQMEELREYVMFFELPFDQTTGSARKRQYQNDVRLDIIQEHIERSGCDVCVFDVWKRALCETDPEAEELSLWRQSAIAKATNTHHILVQHLRGKDLEKRADKRPTREGIKGSGAWIDVPSTILAVHRPSLWKKVDQDTIEIFILAQRYGKAPLVVEFDYDDDSGVINNGRSMEFDFQEERSSLDSFLDQDRPNRRR